MAKYRIEATRFPSSKPAYDLELCAKLAGMAKTKTKESPCIAACGITTENIVAQELARSCGFEKIERDWTQEDFSDDGSYARDFAWNIFYKIV